MTGQNESARLSLIKPGLECRARTLAGIRAFFVRRGFLEVETPLRVPAVAPEQFILPYMSDGWFLSTSPELQMKRLLAAGYENIFQICHCFRRDERGRFHNPEFTMLEWYRSGADYQQIVRDTEDLVVDLVRPRGGSPALAYQGRTIDLTLPWPRITVRETYLRWAGWDPVAAFDGPRFDDDMAAKIMPQIPRDRPLVILDYPRQCASLARLKTPEGEEQVAERAEIFIGGLEIANGFSELTDAAEQEQRFKQEIDLMRKEDKPAALPGKFLEAVKSLPPCAGNAVGVDRLVMLLCDAGSIDDVLAFPAETL